MRVLYFILYILILPGWITLALLHMLAAFVTNVLFKAEEIIGDTLDEIEWEIKAISLVKR